MCPIIHTEYEFSHSVLFLDSGKGKRGCVVMFERPRRPTVPINHMPYHRRTITSFPSPVVFTPIPSPPPYRRYRYYYPNRTQWIPTSPVPVVGVSPSIHQYQPLYSVQTNWNHSRGWLYNPQQMTTMPCSSPSSRCQCGTTPQQTQS